MFRYKVFHIAKNPKYDGCQRELASVAYKFFDKKNILIKMKTYQTKS